jgi:transposase-like protein
MSDGKSIRLVCFRCGSENVRISRQALHFFARAYCVMFRRQRYRCLRCNSKFYGRRRYPDSHQSGSDDRMGVVQRTADRNGAA